MVLGSKRTTPSLLKSSGYRQTPKQLRFAVGATGPEAIVVELLKVAGTPLNHCEVIGPSVHFSKVALARAIDPKLKRSVAIQ
jgi:hypothetical protein